MHCSLSEQYKPCDCEACKNTRLNLAESPTNKTIFKNLLKTAEKAFKKLFKNQNYKVEDLFKNSEYQALVNETAELFTTAIPHEVPKEMRTYLEQDVFVFSALKTHAQLSEVRSYLKDENGNIRPYHDFEQKVLAINKQYNKNYLEAEYEFAVHSSQSAAKWANLQEDESRYWLEYRTAGDDRVREAHTAIRGTVLPKSDPFWQEFYPPNGWRCRCVAVEVLARDYTKSQSSEAINKGKQATTQIGKNGKNKLEMFRFNPGQNKKVFPPNNSYMPKYCHNGKAELQTHQVFLSLEDERCKALQEIEKEAFKRTLKKQRKEITTYLKENLKGKTLTHQKVKQPIHLTIRGFKEALNQPHKHILAKNEAVRNIDTVLPNATYKGITEHKGRTSYLFETTIENETSFIIVNEEKGRGLYFYSVTDSNKVLTEKEKPK